MFRKAWFFLKPYLSILFRRSAAVLADAAADAVRQADREYPNAVGEEKRAVAFAIVRNRLANEGLALAAQTIYGAIEAAVFSKKARQ